MWMLTKSCSGQPARNTNHLSRPEDLDEGLVELLHEAYMIGMLADWISESFYGQISIT